MLQDDALHRVLDASLTDIQYHLPAQLVVLGSGDPKHPLPEQSSVPEFAKFGILLGGLGPASLAMLG